MARTNPYRGVLQPHNLGRGKPSVAVLLLYDIEEDRCRSRVADLCLNYGLERIQFSAFFGRLNRNQREELALRLRREVGDGRARIRLVPLCEEDTRAMWLLDQWALADADELRASAEATPKLRILTDNED